MASYHIDGLQNWKKRALIWGPISTLAALAALPSVFPWILPAIALGAIAGGVSILLVDKDQGRLASIPSYVCIGILIALALTRGGGLSLIGYFSLGSLFTAAEAATSGILGQRLVHRLNHQHREKLAVLEKVMQPAPPPEPITPELQAELIAAVPENLRGEVTAAFEPVILATPFRSLESLPPENSCLSGTPLLAPAETWPSRAGQPLEFLARINLAELPATPMPRPQSGVLSFFYDIEDQPWGGDDSDLNAFAVFYHPEPSSLQAVLKPGSGPHPPLRKPLRFEEVDAFSPSRTLEEQIFEITRHADDDASCRLDELYETALESNPSESHRVLSRPALIQNDMDSELEVAARLHGLPDGAEWTMLLQVESDRDLGWMWGDSGSLYFWVPTADLAAARFDRGWVVLQCC